MDRDEAQKALALLTRVVSQARDDTALQNWGTIWIVHAFSNGGGFAATNWLLLDGVTSKWIYVGLWMSIVILNIGSIFVLKARRAGTRTFIESQIWSIWLTFIAAVILLAVVNHLMGLPLFGLGPVIAILSAVGFSSMGAVMGRRWYLGTLLFGASAIAMALWPRAQFYLLGAVWGGAQLVGGAWLIVDKRRRLRAGEAARLV
jgi:hypothetical protein